METNNAVQMLGALAQASRLHIFQLLVRCAPEGMAAGAIAEALDLPNPTLSFHLAQLSQAGLLHARREGRSLIYAVRIEGIQDLLHFLTQDCCQGRAELCAPVVEACSNTEKQR